jgi:hypothetical protein
MELWKAVEGFDNYQISSLGNVRGIHFKDNNKYLKHHLGLRGYYTINLYKDKKQYTIPIHRLLGIAFIPNPDNLPEIDHINRDRKDNRLQNLRWVSHQENNINKELHSSSGYDNIYLTKFNTYCLRYNRLGYRYSKCFKTLEEAIEERDLLLST